MCLCPGFTLDRKSQTSQYDPYDTYKLQCSHTGFEKPREIALELVYRAENRCKSIGARAGGLFQALLGPIWARKGPKTWIFRLKKKPKSPFDCIGASAHRAHPHTRRHDPKNVPLNNGACMQASWRRVPTDVNSCIAP